MLSVDGHPLDTHPTLSLIMCLGANPSTSEPQGPHLENGENDYTVKSETAEPELKHGTKRRPLVK